MGTIRSQFGPIMMTHRPKTWDHGIIREVMAAYPLDRCEITEERPVILDIGAHIGTFSALCLHRWPKALVVAVEPDPGNFLLLEENAPDASVHQVAVGDPSVGTIHLIRYAEDAAHAPNEGQSAEAWGRNTGGSYTSTSTDGMREDMEDAGEVSVVNLHWLLAFPDGGIDILKLDCEGAEADALRHAGVDLGKIKYIMGEVHSPELQQEMKELLAKTHRIEFTKPGEALSEFFAERK